MKSKGQDIIKKEMIYRNDDEKEIIDVLQKVKGVSIECCSCQNVCCRHFTEVFLLPEEKDFLERNFDIKTTRIGSLDAMVISEGGCRDSANKACLLGDFRPLDCKFYPVALGSDGKISSYIKILYVPIKKI